MTPRFARLAAVLVTCSLLAAVPATAVASTSSSALVIDAATPAVLAAPGAGTLLGSLPVPPSQLLPSAAVGWNVLYLSTGWNGLPTIVSGQVFLPPGPAPQGGWKVISWAHGTLGVARGCAATVSGRSARDTDFLDGWLSAGYAVVATDYQGLGYGPGPHPYLNGAAEAYGVIDMVRAARQLDARISGAWMVSGQSQGGQAALYTADLTTAYAPELNYRGSIATAPPTQWRELVQVAGLYDSSAPVNPYLPLIMAGLGTTQPGTFNPADYLTPLGLSLLDKTRTDCIDQLETDVSGLVNGQVLTQDPAKLARLTDLIATFDVPIAAEPRPVFIAQGTADLTVYPVATQQTADQLAAAGTTVDFRWYPGATHDTTMAAAMPDLLAFAKTQFAG